WHGGKVPHFPSEMLVSRCPPSGGQVQLDGMQVPEGASNASFTAGPFSRSMGFETGSTTSGVWLSANDKQRLRGYRARVFTVFPY
ncbi:hypothetical protein ABRP94_09795, partial [Corynebacterium sp. KPL3739]